MVSLKCLTKGFIIFLQAKKYGYFGLFVAILGQKKSRNNLNSEVSALTGRGIRTSPVTKIKDFEQVPENIVTRFARNNDSSNPYLLLSKKNRHPCGCLFSLGRGIRIRTLNDGVRATQCFIQNAHFKHVSRLSYLSNVSVNFVAFLNTKL